ncbi:MAG TPA: lipoprotein, partial [Gaiellaceae bacterium]|nr:lipoprotein [Gaiellaceae bacterium]
MRALVLVAVAAAFVLSGCGQSGPSKAQRRRAVTRYIDSVDIQERVMTQQLRSITRIYRAFSGNAAKLRRAAPRFTHAEAALRTLRHRVAGVAAPADARVLRRRLLALVDDEIGLARDIADLAVFLPRFQAALAPLGGARTTLKAALAQATIPQP